MPCDSCRVGTAGSCLSDAPFLATIVFASRERRARGVVSLRRGHPSLSWNACPSRVATRRVSPGAFCAAAGGWRPTSARQGRDPLLIHYHIFKNAGTSFTWALKHELGEGFRAFDTPSPKGFVSSRDLTALAHQHPDVFAISSHQAAPPAPKIRGREVLSSILIRDPIARIRSIHSFERRQQVATPGAIKAKELSFREYVEWRLETSPTSLCNFQVYYCTRMEGAPPGRPGSGGAGASDPQP